MKKIRLEKDEVIFIERGIYVIEAGKVLSKQIFSDGKILLNSGYLEKGDLLGNFFELSLDVEVPKFYIEIKAIETTSLEKIIIGNSESLKNGSIYQKIIYQLLLRVGLEIRNKILNRKEYVINILELLSNSEGKINKRLISPDIFNLSKSQYYLLLSQLREEKKIKEEINTILLL